MLHLKKQGKDINMMISNNPKIIDVTLRESIYTDKLISYDVALDIIKKINRLSFCDYIEIGYINTKESNADLAKYNEEYINNAKKITTKKISCMTHLKEFNKSVLVWDRDIIKKLDMVRIIIDSDISDLSEAVNYFHNLGVKVSVNCSYLSRKKTDEIINIITSIVSDGADIIYIADTNGSMLPKQLDEIYNIIKSIDTNIEVGFHGHDHYNMVVANAWKMIENGVDYVDATIVGFGKGAGNLRLEIVPFLLNKINNYHINDEDIHILYDIICNFDRTHIDKFLNILYSYRNLKLKEINEIISNSNEENIVDNILEYDINE